MVVSAAGFAGDRPSLELEHAVSLVSDSILRIDVSYEIPYTWLAFEQDTGGFRGRYSLRVQGWDGRRLVCARDWNEVVREANYDATMRLRSVITGTRRIDAPRRNLTVEVVVQDLQSERSRTWRLKVAAPRYVGDIRLEHTRPVANRPLRTLPEYDNSETLAVRVEVYPAAAVVKTREDPESVAVRLVSERSVRAEQRASCRPAPTDSSGPARVNQFRFPLTDFDNGRHEVVVVAFGPKGKVLEQRKRAFAVRGPFFYSNREYLDRVDKLIWVAADSEIRRLRTAPPPERESLWRAFWRGKDQTPTTEQNEAEESYFERIEFAERTFGHGDRGFRSDRARVYVKLGAPDQRDVMPFESESQAYEEWYYYSLNLKFTFYDERGFGEFKLVEPKNYFTEQEK